MKLKSKKKGVARRKVKKPKTEAGERPVTIPPHVVPILADHLKHHSEAVRYGLVFPRGERWALGTDHFSAPLGEGMQSSRTLAV